MSDVLVIMTGDSGPMGGFYRAGPDTAEHDWMHSGFGSCTFHAPDALVDEYERLSARRDEIETEFGRLQHEQKLRRIAEAQP